MSSLVGNLKDRKTLLICIAIIVLAVIALALIFSGGERKGEGPMVLASKRVKLSVDERAKGAAVAKTTVKAPEKAPPKKVAEKSPPKKKVAKKAPPKKVAKKVVKLAPPKKKVAKKAPPKKVAPAVQGGKLAATLPWAINLASFSKFSAAKALALKLESSGYNAYTTEFEKDGLTWHRVRIGFYRSREEALKVADELSKKKLVRSKPWVVKPQTDEVIKYTK